VSSVLNAIPATAGSVGATYLAAGSVTQTILGTNVAGNGPAFSAYANASQSFTTATATKVQFQTEEFDTNNNFDNVTNYRFTPTVAGYYQVNAGIAWSGAYTAPILMIYKDGIDYKDGVQPVGTVYRSTVNALVYCNGSTNYIEIYAIQNSGSTGTSAAAISYTYFQAAMVRSA
jgi:hypothetical protein